MTVQTQIEWKMKEGLGPEHLEVVNESHKHNVPPGSQTHFKVVVVSERFEGKNLLERHREVYALLADEMAKKHFHALAIHTFTPTEWAKERTAHLSPPCLGGSQSH